jgi:hypothetical protein
MSKRRRRRCVRSARVPMLPKHIEDCVLERLACEGRLLLKQFFEFLRLLLIRQLFILEYRLTELVYCV